MILQIGISSILLKLLIEEERIDANQSGLRSRCYCGGVGWTEQTGVTPFAGIQQLL